MSLEGFSGTGASAASLAEIAGGVFAVRAATDGGTALEGAQGSSSGRVSCCGWGVVSGRGDFSAACRAATDGGTALEGLQGANSGRVSCCGWGVVSGRGDFSAACRAAIDGGTALAGFRGASSGRVSRCGWRVVSGRGTAGVACLAAIEGGTALAGFRGASSGTVLRCGSGRLPGTAVSGCRTFGSCRAAGLRESGASTGAVASAACAEALCRASAVAIRRAGCSVTLGRQSPTEPGGTASVRFLGGRLVRPACWGDAPAVRAPAGEAGGDPDKRPGVAWPFF